MRRTAILLTAAAVATLSSAAQIQSRLASRLTAPQTFSDHQLVQVAAAAMWGGQGQEFAELQDQAADAVTQSIYKKMKEKLAKQLQQEMQQ